MARTDVLTTAKRIRRQLASQHRLEVMQLNAAITSSDTQLVMTATMPASVRAGVVLECGIELMWVTSINAGTNTATVIRGYLDSTAAAHATTDLVGISPRFSMLDIVEAMIDEINSWAPQIYKVVDDTFTVATTAETLELPAAWTTMLGVCQVRQSELIGTSGDDVTAWPVIPAKFIRGSITGFDGATTSGMLLRFTEPIRTGAVYVRAALPFDTSTLATTDDLLTGLGLADTQLDVLQMGVRRRVMLQNDNNLTARQPQDEARRAEENPIGGLMSIHQLGLALYTRRRSEEAARLARLYPYRMQ